MGVRNKAVGASLVAMVGCTHIITLGSERSIAGVGQWQQCQRQSGPLTTPQFIVVARVCAGVIAS